MKNSIIDVTSTVLTVVQTNEVIALICGILTCISIILGMVLKVLDWYKRAKQDGKITPDEIKEVVQIAKDGVEEISENIKK